ncbi:hypothetical protein NIES932_23190 [Raphidiopsis curvata NIES-932]|nr:hypothetical protein NIES932_23190 [Raphidiopsis curvata NIES-932]
MIENITQTLEQRKKEALQTREQKEKVILLVDSANVFHKNFI